MNIKYISRGDWFDEDTEVELLVDFGIPENQAYAPGQAGLFRGLRNGRIDEEVCGFDEFNTIATSSGFLDTGTDGLLRIKDE